MLKDPDGSCDQCYHHRDSQERPPSPEAYGHSGDPSCMTPGWPTLNTSYQI